MEDLNDNMHTHGKRYYFSKCEWVYTEKYLKSLGEGLKAKFTGVVFKDKFLVCASNRENAQQAVTNMLEKDGKNLVLKARIDNLIVGL